MTSALPPLFDMHCHLGFAPDAPEIAEGFAVRGAGAFACTVTPAEYAVCAQSVQLAALRAVRWGVGLHPWWVHEQGAEGLDRFCCAAAPARYVGEVGLDFGARHGGNAEQQIAAFKRVCAVLAAHPGKLVSVHAVRAVDDVLDCLEHAGALAGNTIILHWFSGTSQQLARALRAGCWISLGELSLGTKRGRAYAVQAARAGRLLLETDWPPQDGPARGFEDFYAHLQNGARLLEEAAGEDALLAACEHSKSLLAL